MHRLNSSLRKKHPSETFSIASQYRERFGISRVTETTWLDTLGIPVAVSIRPKAQQGSLIVTAGKGFESIEAKTGALMEAIELAFSEEPHSNLKKHIKPASAVLSIEGKPSSILDLCPILDAEIDLDASMSVVKMKDILNQTEAFLPAELAFVPFQLMAQESRYFGYHTNGLASGNTFEEAVIHGIYEVFERDILSFEFIRDQSYLVEEVGLPTQANTILERVKNAGLKMVVKTVPNTHRIPFFKAYVVDQWAGNPTSINAGYGCHANPNIALIRAMIEAVQSRMSYIHGGREDLNRGHSTFEQSNDNYMERFRKDYESVVSAKGILNLRSITHPALPELSIEDHFHALLDWINLSGSIRQIFVGSHTRESDDIQVVKVIIPGMEFFNQETRRIGPRLRDFIQNIQA